MNPDRSGVGVEHGSSPERHKNRLSAKVRVGVSTNNHSMVLEAVNEAITRGLTREDVGAPPEDPPESQAGQDFEPFLGPGSGARILRSGLLEVPSHIYEIASGAMIGRPFDCSEMNFLLLKNMFELGACVLIETEHHCQYFLDTNSVLGDRIYNYVCDRSGVSTKKEEFLLWSQLSQKLTAQDVAILLIKLVEYCKKERFSNAES